MSSAKKTLVWLLMLIFHLENKLLKRFVKPTPLLGLFIEASNTGILEIYKYLHNYDQGSPFETGNYIPISLLSNVDKILERLVHATRIKFLGQNKILRNKQFGFRKKHSSVHGLVTLTEDIRKSIDEGKLCVEY